MADRKSHKTASQPTDDGAQQAKPSRFPVSASIQARVIFGEVTYFALTSEQIDTYAALGWLITVCLTLVGVLLELAFGCWLALTQGNLSLAADTTINTTMWVTGVIGLLMAVLAGVFWWLRAKNKRGWLANTVQLEQ